VEDHEDSVDQSEPLEGVLELEIQLVVERRVLLALVERQVLLALAGRQALLVPVERRARLALAGHSQL
jgi:hypothetical protein